MYDQDNSTYTIADIGCLPFDPLLLRLAAVAFAAGAACGFQPAAAATFPITIVSAVAVCPASVAHAADGPPATINAHTSADIPHALTNDATDTVCAVDVLCNSTI